MDNKDSLKEIIKKTGVYECLDCAKCTGICPVSRINYNFSPRKIVSNVITKGIKDLSLEPDLWLCLTCGQCSNICPSNVAFPEFMTFLRSQARNVNNSGTLTHTGTLQAITEVQTKGFTQNRVNFIHDKSLIAEESDYLYYIGCSPFFKTIFEYINAPGNDTAVIKALNKLNIKPVISNAERCCGHDAYFTGDIETFKKLAAFNIEMLKQSKAKKIVFTCPECLYTFKVIYPQYFDMPKLEFISFIELLYNTPDITFGETEEIFTYHDPCRLGRFLNIYDEPRLLLQKVKGLQVKEMNKNKELALCCGSSQWVSCGYINKIIQLNRLKEADATGASTLLTACDKCRIHLGCALNDGEIKTNIKIKDINVFLADLLIS